MADNTTINLGVGGDTIRDVQRPNGIKTQVVALDLGGAASNSEVLVSAGNNPAAVAIPVVMAFDWSDPSIRQKLLLQQQMLMLQQAQSINGFVPFETPTIGA